MQPHTYDANQFQTGYDLGSLQQHQQVGGDSEQQNQTQAQVHPQFPMGPGNSDTGYGQIGASTDSQAQLPVTNSNLQEHSNFTTSSGYMAVSQGPVQPGQQFGTQSTSGVVPPGQREGFQQQVEGTASSTDGGAQVAYDSCKFLMASIYM